MKTANELLGKTLDAPDVKAWFATFPEPPRISDGVTQDNCLLTFASSGVEVRSDKPTRRITSLCFYGPGGRAPAYQRGELPYGLTVDMTAAQVIALLDSTLGNRLVDEPREKGWVTPEGSLLSIDLARDLHALATISIYT